MSKYKRSKVERYDFQDSPWVQNMNQRDFARLLGTTKQRLETLIKQKDAWIIRRKALIGTKIRDLAYPRGQLRTVHERIKIHLDKIKQPEYLYSPRRRRSQRDNAALHRSQHHFLSLDIKQFYPSTSSEHIFRWAHHNAGLKADVAGMFVHLVTVDGRMSFGSPLSPILATHVHRKMFDEIYAICKKRGLRMSLWVDDITISGKFIRGELVSSIREIVRSNGLRSHKIQFRTGNRPVVITGIPVQENVAGPRSLHERIRKGYADLRAVDGAGDYEHAIDRLLGHLGTYRYYVGPATQSGRITANRMESLRRRRTGPRVGASKAIDIVQGEADLQTLASDEESPF